MVKKKKVVLRGPCYSASGYGIHIRQLARWLLSREDVDLTIIPTPWGNTPWLLDASMYDGLIGKMHRCTKPPEQPFDVSFQVQLPNEWDPKLARFNVGLTAGVETTVCNPAWVKCIDAMTHVIVPSGFVKQMFIKTGASDEKICVIPESFPDALAASVHPHLSFSTKFNFLTVGQLTSRNSDTDRKNTFNLIKWFCETFRENEDVGLVIKTNSGRESKIDRILTKDTLKQVLGVTRSGQFPKVHLIHGLMTDIEMASLYVHPEIKAFISLTRGEGFGLPLLEAAASGLPVIATGWSGHLSFLDLIRFIKLDYELQELPKARLDSNIFMAGAKWAQVHESDVKRKLKKFYDRPNIPKEWAVKGKSIIQEKFSFAAISAAYDVFWSKLESDKKLVI